MSGIFTDKRDLSKDALVYTWTDQGVPRVGSPSTLKLLGLQETTSYRSGRELSDDQSLLQDSRIYGAPREIRSSTDTGHEFQSVTSRFISTNQPAYDSRYNGVVIKRGPLIISGVAGDPFKYHMPSVQPMTANEQISYGQRAISGCAPTAPSAGLAAFSGELFRDGIPSLIGSLALRSKRLSSLGSEYLNVEFGWKPLVSDVTKLMKSVLKSAQTIRQMQRDSGQVVRRRFSFPPERSITEGVFTRDVYQNAIHGYTSYEAAIQTPITTSTLRNEEVWFSGAFSYYTDPGKTMIGKVEKYEALANKVLGTRITPSVLWQLAPWSWLVDWFVDFGSAFQTADLLANDGLVIRWGYLMRRTDVFKTLRCEVKLPYNVPGPNTVVINSYRTTRKERWRASPYGFAVNTDAFSVQQLAILGALGISRGNRVGW